MEEDCKVVNSDMLIHLPECKKYVYHDLIVICGNPEFAEKRKARSEAIMNPQIVVEVLSNGTAEYDIGEKMIYYLKLKSLKTICCGK